MKRLLLMLLSAAFPCLAGCASAPRLAKLESVGPAPAAQPENRDTGTIQVYSARQQTRLDANTEVFFEGEKFLQDMRSLPAHTDYTVYGQDGTCLQQVRNARNIDDDQPARVSLAPGRYQVEAKTENDYGEITTVRIPVVIAPGKATVVHLEGDWRPAGHYSKTGIVRLPNGRIAGWRAEPAEVLHTAAAPQAN